MGLYDKEYRIVLEAGEREHGYEPGEKFTVTVRADNQEDARLVALKKYFSAKVIKSMRVR